LPALSAILHRSTTAVRPVSQKFHIPDTEVSEDLHKTVTMEEFRGL
jgi:hypothetical protein